VDSVLAPVWISLKTAVTTTIITFCLGVSAAWWMSQYQGKGKSVIEGVLTAPLVLPPTVVGFLLLLALGKNGFLGRSLNLVGIRVVFSWYATVIAATVVAFPLMYKSALAAFQQIDRPDNKASQRNLIACARTLGASETTIFWRIILPLAKPGLIAGTLLAFACALGEFGATLMVAGNIPGKTQTIPLAIYLAAESGAMDRALRLVIILLGISLGLIVSINYWDKEKNCHKSRNHRGSSSRAYKANKNISTEKINLQVDIQKQLPDFLLDISFEIDSAQIPLGILGASGAGKTTLLRCIAGLESPDRGVIRLNNQTLFNSARARNRFRISRLCSFSSPYRG
jgi:molybdate transport system permease protein